MGSCCIGVVSIHIWFFFQYMNSQMTASRLLYQYNGNPYTCKCSYYIKTEPWWIPQEPMKIWFMVCKIYGKLFSFGMFPTKKMQLLAGHSTTWWRHWPFMRGIYRPPENSLHKGWWRGALMLYLICAWTNGWVNNRDAGDLRGPRSHYNVTVMTNKCSFEHMFDIRKYNPCKYFENVVCLSQCVKVMLQITK